MVVAIERHYETGRAPLHVVEREEARVCRHCGCLDFCRSCYGSCYVCGRELVTLEAFRQGPTPFTSTLRVLRYCGDSPAMRELTMMVRTVKSSERYAARLAFTCPFDREEVWTHAYAQRRHKDRVGWYVHCSQGHIIKVLTDGDNAPGRWL